MRMRGVVKSLLDSFGFIAVEGSRDHFFLPSGLQQSQRFLFIDLREGMKVEFTSIVGKKGLRAIDILVLEDYVDGNH